MPAAAAYSPQVEARGGAAAAGCSSESSPVMATTSIAPLRRTSAASREPPIDPNQRRFRGLPTTMRVMW